MDTKTKDVVLRTVGLTVAMGAGLELWLLGHYVRELAGVWSTAVASGQSTVAWTNASFLLIFSLLMLAALAGGIQVARRRPMGVWLALAGVVPQLVSIAVSGFQYRCAMFGVVAVGAVGSDELFRLGFFAEAGSRLLLGFEATSQWTLHFNVVAIGFVAALLVLGRRKATDRAEAENVAVPA